ncbi:hypothetical protein TNCV_3452071 [Trichonephila clavipes]|nr:hypothetical protein TNCV_3452071 [Trichonephila clavipes]
MAALRLPQTEVGSGGSEIGGGLKSSALRAEEGVGEGGEVDRGVRAFLTSCLGERSRQSRRFSAPFLPLRGEEEGEEEPLPAFSPLVLFGETIVYSSREELSYRVPFRGRDLK